MDYGPEIDIWSSASVICEPASGYPLFCADDEAQLIEMIVEMRRLPPIALVKAAPRAGYSFDEDGQMRCKADGCVAAAASVMEATKFKDADFGALIERCLQWAPEKRLTASQIAQHPWVRDR
jgi:serine/threonine protein kinase